MQLDLQQFRLPPLPRAAEVRAIAADILEPPPDIDVAEAAELHRHLRNPGGGYSGPWRNAIAPYLVEPMRACTDPRFGIVVFVAPAQSGKTEIGLNFAGYAIETDPADFQIVLPEKQLAEDFSARRIGRMIDASPAYEKRLKERKTFSATFDRCIVNLSWPTSTNASSKPVPWNWLDERDSMADDVDGEGDPVALYDKRSQTFGARRKTLVTSSPKRPPKKGAPKPVGAHEAPACDGVLALYNEGTRKFFYWPCRECGDFFVTRAQDLQWQPGAKSTDELIEVTFACQHCGGVHGESDRRELWARGEWRAEDASRFTRIDSYWLFGPQAKFITLEELVRKRLRAEEKLGAIGSDTDLRTWWNVDAGEVYFPASDDETGLAAEDLRAAAKELPLAVMPERASVLMASIDVQSDRFEFQLTAFGRDSESWLIDHQRLVAVSSDGKPITTGGGAGGAVSLQGSEPCDPAHRQDHWQALVPAVFDRVIPLELDPAKGLTPLIVVIDTGGPSGVTDKAYRFARWLRRERPDIAPRAMFIKGRGGRNPVRVARAQWDPKITATRQANRRGVDLWHVWVDELKDAVAARLRRFVKSGGEPGPDRLHVSALLPEAIFQQLCAETRDGEEWVNERRVSNEAWDLAVYALAGWLRNNGDKIDWDDPPRWAQPSAMATPTSAAAKAKTAERLPVKPAPLAPQQPAARAPIPSRPPRTGGWVSAFMRRGF